MGRSTEERDVPLVLVVDDYADTREIVGEVLMDAGFQVAEAATGPEAIDTAERLLPDVILMDLSLPEIDGWEVTRRLRNNAATSRIGIIALTAHALEAHAQSAREAGCDSVVIKPCDSEALLSELRTVLARREQPR